MMEDELHVVGTAWRPSFLPLIVLTHNNLNPAASFNDSGLRVKVILTTQIPWAEIDAASVKKGLITTYCVISSGQSTYHLHFRDREKLGILVRELRGRGVEVKVPARIEKDL